MFIKMKNLFSRRELNLNLRIRFLKYYILVDFLNGCESWTLDVSLEKRIKAAFKFLCLQIYTKNFVKTKNEPHTNFQYSEKSRELLNIVEERKLRYCDRIRDFKYEILGFITEGKIAEDWSEGFRMHGRKIYRTVWSTSIELFW